MLFTYITLSCITNIREFYRSHSCPHFFNNFYLVQSVIYSIVASKCLKPVFHKSANFYFEFISPLSSINQSPHSSGRIIYYLSMYRRIIHTLQCKCEMKVCLAIRTCGDLSQSAMSSFQFWIAYKILISFSLHLHRALNTIRQDFMITWPEASYYNHFLQTDIPRFRL